MGCEPEAGKGAKSKKRAAWHLALGAVVSRFAMPLAFFIWFAGLIAAYYVVQKPWALQQQIAGPLALADLIIAATILFVCGGLGKRLFTGSQIQQPLERFAMQLAVGIIPISLLVLGLGVLSLYRAWIFWGLLILSLILLAKDGLAWISNLRTLAANWQGAGAMGRFFLLFCGFVLIISLLESLAPPIKWDSLAYHLEMPQRFLDAGRIYFLEDIVYFGFPQTAEMLFTWAMGLRTGSTAAVLGWGVGFAALLGISGFAQRLLGLRAGILVLPVFLVGVSIANGLSWAYVDLWVMLFGTLVFIALDYFSHSRKPKWLLLAGAGAGAAFGTKYTGGFVLILGATMLLMIHYQDRSGKEGREYEPQSGRIPTWLFSLLLFAGIAFIVSLPWLIKNLAYTYNPLYPYLFGGKEMDALRQGFLQGNEISRSLLDDLLLPLTATVLGVEDALEYTTSIGPLFLALLPGLLLGWRKISQAQRRSLVPLIAVAIVTWILWAAMAHVSEPFLRSRHYFGALPAIAILSVAGYEAVCRLHLPQIRVASVVNAMVLLTLILAGLSQAYYLSSIQPLATVLGTETNQAYRFRRLGWHAAAMQSVNALPDQSRVLLLWEPRSYYCDVNCDPDEFLDHWWYLLQTSVSPTGIARDLKQDGYSYVLMYDLGIEFLKETETEIPAEQWLALEVFINEHLRLLDSFGDAYSLYVLD